MSGGEVEAAARHSFEMLLAKPDEIISEVWLDSCTVVTSYITEAMREANQPPLCVFFKGPPHEAVMWLNRKERERLWREVRER